MIPHNFVYYRPASLEEAVSAYVDAQAAGLAPLYYAGGTEIVTFCRRGSLRPGAVVDIKQIPECAVLEMADGILTFGAALTLNTIIEDGGFPLLAQAATIVDHTVRNRLTLGGNIAGRLPYRETVLPFLLADAAVNVSGPTGDRITSLRSVFNRRLQLEPGELLVSLSVPATAAQAPWTYGRRVRKTRLDYPILTACFMEVGGEIRSATTGAFGFPWWSPELDRALNDANTAVGERPVRALEAAGMRIADNARASAAYRRMLLETTFTEALDVLL